MLDRFFRLTENKTSVKIEILCGFTTFLTMMYILFTNSDILSETGMPWQGVFVATALVAGLCTISIALYSNLPFAMAPGMGYNTIFSYAICMNMGFDWREGLAIVFLAGVLHTVIMMTSLRKAFVNAFPEYLRVAAGVGLGMFIAYVGIKNTGLLTFSFPLNYGELPSFQSIISGSLIVPGIIKYFSAAQIIAVISMTVMIILSALEKKTGNRYATLPLGILIAAFIGIPMNVTGLTSQPVVEASMSEGFRQIFFSFFGRPGLLSIFSDPSKALHTIMMICILLMTGLLDSVGTMIGLGQIHNAKIFDGSEMERFTHKGIVSKQDKALISNAVGNMVSPVLGVSSSTIYLESVTGIVSGGRTGLTGLVAGVLFLLCLPFTSFFHIIPSEAVAPALILAGASMLTRMKHINWRSFDESFPAFMTIMFMPLSYSILDGIVLGIISHIIIKITMGKRREIHPILLIIAILYIAIKIIESL